MNATPGRPEAPSTSKRRWAPELLYVCVIIACMLGAYAYSIRGQSIFSCPATGYSADSYLAYCHATHFGDYDHGAFWFDLEPGVRPAATKADALFLGNSHMQFAFSTDQTDVWFAEARVPYYLMGFAYWENHLFEAPLMQRVGTRAKVFYVSQIDVRPPTIVMVVNKPELFKGQYERYFLNQLREHLPYSEVPIKLVFSERKRMKLGELMARNHGAASDGDEE